MKKEKTKAERLQEGMSLLTQLKNGGVRSNSNGFLALKQQVSEWVDSGKPWEGTIPFIEYGREAVVSFPKYNNRAAGLNFKVVKSHLEEN
jgi:phage head maturation protease